MTAWVIMNIENGQMQVGKNGLFLTMSSSGLDASIHAVQWDGSEGEVEYRNVEGESTYNEVINSFDAYAFAETAYDDRYAEVLTEQKQDAYDAAYDNAIASGSSEEDAVAAGNSARDAVTSVSV